ncbi:MAG: rRNA maturation RNase YbeY [bacterium]
MKTPSENKIIIEYKKKLKVPFGSSDIIINVLKQEKKTGLEINLMFTDNVYIKKINLEYRQLNKATDVISFEEANGGDIVISVEKAEEQAREYGVSLKEELQRLLIHGLLHILGYDHIKASDKIKMQLRERKYMKKNMEKN